MNKRDKYNFPIAIIFRQNYVKYKRIIYQMYQKYSNVIKMMKTVYKVICCFTIICEYIPP